MSAIDPTNERQRAILAELTANAPVAPDRLRERVLAAAPAARRRLGFSLPSRRRLVLVVVPLAVAGAVAAAIVHGAFSSGPTPSHNGDQAVLGLSPHNSPSLAAAPHTTAQKRAAAAPHTTAQRRDFAPAGTTAVAGATGYALGANQEDAVSIPKNRLVHADASLEVQVPSHAALSRATNNATAIVSSLGGYAQSVQYQSSRSGTGNSYLTLRVPVGKAETALGKLGALGVLVSQQIATQDLQHQLTKQTSRISTLRREIAVYKQALQGSLSETDRVQIQIRLENAEHSAAAVRKARSGTVAEGATADISLTLTTNQHAIVGGGNHKRGRFGRLIHGAAGFLGLEGIIVLYALVVLSPFIMLGLLGWGLVRERRRRDERRLLASA